MNYTNRFITYADELSTLRPIMSYYCRLHAVNHCLSLAREGKITRMDPALEKLLDLHLKVLEELKPTLSERKEDHQAAVKDFVDLSILHINDEMREALNAHLYLTKPQKEKARAIGEELLKCSDLIEVLGEVGLLSPFYKAKQVEMREEVDLIIKAME